MRKDFPRNRLLDHKALDVILENTIPAVEAAVIALQEAVVKTNDEARRITNVETRIRDAMQEVVAERQLKINEIAKVMYLFGASSIQPVFAEDGTTEIGEKWVIEFPATEGNGQGLPRFEESLAAAMAVD